MIIHSAKETGQQNEQWDWALEVKRKWGGGGDGEVVGQNLKEKVEGR